MRLMLAALPGIAVAGAALAGCSDSPEGLSEWAGSQELVDGTIVTSNPPTPLLATDAISVRVLWSVSNTTDVWERPTRVAIGADRAFVLDQLANRVYSVSLGGDTIGSFGGQGDGPGEISRAYDLAVCEEKVIVGDGGSSGFQIFDQSDAYVETVSLGRVAFGFAALDDCRLVMRTLLGREGSWNVVSLDDQAPPITMPDLSTRMIVGDSDCEGVRAIGRYLLRKSCILPVLQIITAEPPRSMVVHEIRIEASPAETSADSLRSLEKEMRKRMAEVGLSAELADSQIESILEKSRFAKPYSFAEFDSVRGLFILVQHTSAGVADGERQPTSTFHIFTGGGAYLGAARLGLELVELQIQGEIIFALSKDPATDLVELVRLELTVNADAADVDSALGLERPLHHTPLLPPN